MKGELTLEDGPSLCILQLALSVELVDLEVASVAHSRSLKNAQAAHMLFVIHLALECDFLPIGLVPIGNELLNGAMSPVILVLAFIPENLLT